MTGIDVFLEVLHHAGVRYIVGNPGTTELPLNDALARDSRFTYIFGLHEIPVLAITEGYAMASGTVGVCNLHTACGLGNAMGMLVNAQQAGTPLLVTAGQQDRRMRLHEPVLEGDLVRLAQPLVKWAYEIQRVEDIPTATRRAIQVALTPPTGPVFLSFPLDVQTQSCSFTESMKPHVPDRRVRPPLAALERTVELLATAKNPVLLAGSRVTATGACDVLAELAEWLAAPVYAECGTSRGRLPIRTDHPHYRGGLPLWSPDVHALLAPHDVALCVGMNVLRLYIHHEPEQPLPPSLTLLHLDNVPWELGKNYPPEVALLGDPKAGLEELVALLRNRFPALAERRTHGLQQAHARREQEQTALRQRAAEERKQQPMTPLTLMHTLAEMLPANAVVVEEAPTTGQQVLEKLGVLRDPTGYFGQRGWALGWGLGCAIGVKLAWPDRPVVALLGDGSALYGIQGLWTAAKHDVPVTFIIANNTQYKILKVCGDRLPLPEMAKQNYVAMDITHPRIDYIQLAQSFGVPAQRIAEPDDLKKHLQYALSCNHPMLLEVEIS